MLPLPYNVTVLNARQFRSLAELRTAAEGCSNPALLVVLPEQVPEVLNWLKEKDDLCLSGASEDLLRFRTHRLAVRERVVRGEQPSMDLLTGLTSRRHTLYQLREMTAKQTSQPLSVILGDMDKFKFINDSFGHAVGDKVLCKVAEVLGEHPDLPIVGRFGGDEFMMIVECDENEAMRIAEDVRQQVEAIEFGQRNSDSRLSVTISLGVGTKLAAEPRDLIDNADRALHDGAKADGRNCCVHFSEM